MKTILKRQGRPTRREELTAQGFGDDFLVAQYRAAGSLKAAVKALHKGWSIRIDRMTLRNILAAIERERAQGEGNG